MKRSWITICLFCLLSQGFSQAVEQIRFNSQLIELRHDYQNNNIGFSEESLKNILQEWQSLKNVNSINFKNHQIESINNHLNALSNHVLRNETSQVIVTTEKIINQMHQLRLDTRTEMPFDILWKSYKSFNKLHNTVNDQMLDLYDWFEFEDQFNDFQCRWEDYDLIPKKVLLEYHPSHDLLMRQELSSQMQICINDFLVSTEKGFRPDFVMPCDKIKQVIDKSMLLFTDSSFKGI